MTKSNPPKSFGLVPRWLVAYRGGGGGGGGGGGDLEVQSKKILQNLQVVASLGSCPLSTTFAGLQEQ